MGAAGNGSPEYCKQCKLKRRALTACDDCTQPIVWPELNPAINLWNALQTQWRRDSNNLICGLDYSTIKPVIELLEIDTCRQLFEFLRAMESEALAIVVERYSKK